MMDSNYKRAMQIAQDRAKAAQPVSVKAMTSKVQPGIQVTHTDKYIGAIVIEAKVETDAS